MHRTTSKKWLNYPHAKTVRGIRESKRRTWTRKQFRFTFRKNCSKNVVKNGSSRDIEEEIDAPRIKSSDTADIERKNIISEERRLNSIFQICLEPHVLGDYLSQISPKNFVVQYFTVSRNHHPVKNCCESQCPFAISAKKRDHSNRNHSLLCSRSTSSSDSCCTSKTFNIESSGLKKKDAVQQTEPEQSWQARCSNFIINLPVTLSDKLFGPRLACETLEKDSNRTLCQYDSKANKSQPITKNIFKPSSKDQGNKKSVKSREGSLEDCGCHKNIEPDRTVLDEANKVDPCHMKTSQSFREEVPSERSHVNSKRSTVTCKKVIPNCPEYSEDDRARFGMSANCSDNIRSQGSEVCSKPQTNCRNRDQTSSSISGEKKGVNTFLRFSNWPAIISEKVFGPRNEKVLRCSVIDNKVGREEATNEVNDSPGNISQVDSSSATIKGRLLLKKYTISQTPEAMEETLCFDVLSGKRLIKTRSKLLNEVCPEMTSGNQQRLGTIQEQNEFLGKCLITNEFHESKRCAKSRRNSRQTSSRKVQQLEKKTSTEHIFLSSLIMKLLNRHRNDKNPCKEKKGYWNKRKHYEKKCPVKHKTNIISRKYATTEIQCPRYIKKDSIDSCFFEQDVSQDCRTDTSPNVPDKNQAVKKITGDSPNGDEVVLDQGNTRTYISEDNLENVRDSSTTGTGVMTHSGTDRSQDKPSNKKKCNHCDSSKSSKVKKLVESGVLRVIDKTFREESRELCRIALHRKKCEPESVDVRKKCCREISSPQKFACRVRKRNRIGCNEGVCKLLLFDDHEISDSTKSGSPQSSVDGTRRTLAIVGENICVKAFHDRETSTDDLSELSRQYQNSEFLEKQSRNQESIRTHTLSRENVKNDKNRSPSKPNTGETKNSERLNRSPDETSDPLSRSPSKEGSPLKRKSDSRASRQSNNAMRIKVDRKECVGLSCKEGACWVNTGRISKSEEVPEVEENAGKVFPALCARNDGKRENTICGDKTCLHKVALIESETEEGSEISKENECCHHKQSIALRGSSEDNDYTSLTKTYCSTEKRGDSTTHLDDNRNESANGNQRLSEIHMRISNHEKQSTWTKSPRRDLVVGKLESQNIINSFYSQRKNKVPSRRESRNNENVDMKKVRLQREQGGSTSEKNVTKARKPFQRIENVSLQVGCAATNVPLINDDKSKKQNAFHEENSIVDKKTQENKNGSVLCNEVKEYSIQTISIDTPTFPESFVIISNNDHPSSIGTLSETNSVNSSKIAQRPPSRLLKEKNQTAEGISSPTIVTNLKRNAGKSCLKKEDIGIPGKGKFHAKDGVKIAEILGKRESPNRLTRSIDSCDSKSSGRQKHLEIPVHMLDKENNAKAQTLQMELSPVEKDNIRNSDLGEGPSYRVAKRDENSKSSKSPSLQKHRGEQKEYYKSGNTVVTVGEGKKAKENKRTKGNQSKSKAVVSEKKNDNDKRSTPLKLLSQIDSNVVDANDSTQGQNVTINADLFHHASIDEKNNIGSSCDLQSSVIAANFRSDRILTSENNEELRKSNNSMGQSGSKAWKSSEISNKTPGSEKTHARIRNYQKLRNFKKSTSTVSENLAEDSGVKWIPNHNAITKQKASNEEVNSSKSSHAVKCSGNLENTEKKVIPCITEREDEGKRLEDAITEVRDSDTSKIKYQKPTESEYKEIELKRLSKDFQDSISNEETKKEIARCDNISDKLTTLRDSTRIISDSLNQNFSFTEDLKRFVEHGQQFFGSKKGRNCNQTSQWNYGEQEAAAAIPCDSGNNFDENKMRFELIGSCKNVDYEKLKTYSAKVYGGDQTSNNSISSVQKAYTTLKTILNQTKNIQKGFSNTKQSKETQTYQLLFNGSSITMEDCIMSQKNSESLDQSDIR